MWEAVTSVYKAFVSLMMTFKATDVLDIMIVAFIIYNLIKIVRETRAEQLVKGILVLIVAFFISGLFSLKMLNALFSSFFQFSVLAVLIVFQPELRSALEHIGRSKIAKYWNSLSGGKTMEFKLEPRDLRLIKENSGQSTATTGGPRSCAAAWEGRNLLRPNRRPQ